MADEHGLALHRNPAHGSHDLSESPGVDAVLADVGRDTQRKLSTAGLTSSVALRRASGHTFLSAGLSGSQVLRLRVSVSCLQDDLDNANAQDLSSDVLSDDFPDLKKFIDSCEFFGMLVPPDNKHKGCPSVSGTVLCTLSAVSSLVWWSVFIVEGTDGIKQHTNSTARAQQWDSYLLIIFPLPLVLLCFTSIVWMRRHGHALLMHTMASVSATKDSQLISGANAACRASLYWFYLALCVVEVMIGLTISSKMEEAASRYHSTMHSSTVNKGGWVLPAVSVLAQQACIGVFMPSALAFVILILSVLRAIATQYLWRIALACDIPACDKWRAISFCFATLDIISQKMGGFLSLWLSCYIIYAAISFLQVVVLPATYTAGGGAASLNHSLFVLCIASTALFFTLAACWAFVMAHITSSFRYTRRLIAKATPFQEEAASRAGAGAVQLGEAVTLNRLQVYISSFEPGIRLFGGLSMTTTLVLQVVIYVPTILAAFVGLSGAGEGTYLRYLETGQF